MLRSLAILLLFSTSALIADPVWEHRGPFSADVTDLATDPASSTVFAATTGGVFRSTDGGDSWTAVADVPRQHFHQVAVDVADARYVYAAGSSGVYRSTDGGTRWSRLTGGLADATFYHFEIDSLDPSVLYASVLNGSAVYTSTDRGQSWRSAALPAQVRFLAADAGAVYAGMERALSVSRDQGRTWSAATMPGTSLFALFAGGGTLWAQSTVYVLRRSTDGGATWTDFPNPPQQQPANEYFGLNAFTWDSATRTVYIGMGGVSRAREGDTQWTFLGTVQPLVVAAAISPRAGLLVGTAGGGVVRSPAVNGVWLRSSNPMPTSSVNVIVPHPTKPSTIYVGADGGLFRSNDAGRTYEQWGLRDTFLSVTGVAIDGDRIVAATKSDGIFLSVDGGETWTQPSGGAAPFQVWALAVHPSDPSRLAVASSDGVHVSLDGGSTWRRPPSQLTELTRFVAWDPAATGTMFASSQWSGRWRSTDAGTTWERVNSSLWEPSFTAYFIDPARPARLYSSTFGRGLLISTDRGASWSVLDPRIAGVQEFAVGPDSALYAVTLEKGLFRSIDGGHHWDLYASPQPGVSFTAIAAEASPSRALWLGTTTGAFRTRDTPPRRRTVRH